MGLLRTALLRASESRWLEKQVKQRRFAQHATRRFIPGEEIADALNASATLRSSGISTVLTQLGEDIADRVQAEQVAAHYVSVLDQISARALRAQISLKPTQLGLDVSPELCLEQTRVIVEHAATRENTVWIDMESSRHVEATIDIYRTLRADYGNIGLCLQAYLHRTPDDLETLVADGASIRLVKGAYNEPASIAIRSKADVDTRFLELAVRLLREDARRGGAVHGIATHDMRLVMSIQTRARESGVPNDAYEFQMLYGIRSEDQRRLAAEGFAVRTLVSYGSAWFAWYMRRLAERPANLWFVIRSVF